MHTGKVLPNGRWECGDYRCAECMEASTSGGGAADQIQEKREPEEPKGPTSTELREWAEAVKERDGHTCQECGATEPLHSHHIKPKAEYPDMALDLDNGVTLCVNCHDKKHPNIPIACNETDAGGRHAL